MQNSLRLFIALELSQGIHDQLSGLIGDLQKNNTASIKWVKPENMHLTLKFLGESPKNKIPQIQQVMEHCCQNEKPFQLIVRGTGVFPSQSQPRILWAGIEHSQSMDHLYRALEEGLSVLGFSKESRPFSPHLTLGRINDGINPSITETTLKKLFEAKEKEFGKVIVRRITLFQSTLTAGGPIYTSLSRSQFSD